MRDELHAVDNMRVDRGSRGGKKGSIQSRDGLVVTVPNPETAECRLKPPVVSSHPRKIVLNQNKTGMRLLYFAVVVRCTNNGFPLAYAVLSCMYQLNFKHICFQT